MKSIHLLKTGAVIPAFAVLTACSSVADWSASQQGPIDLLPATQPSLPDYQATNDLTADMAGWLNTVRQTVGLPVLPIHKGVQQSAQDHADYQVINHSNGHYEIRGRPGFTGSKPIERINARHPSILAGEVNVYYTGYGPSVNPNGVQVIQTLIDAPFHRIIMFSDFKMMGVGYDTDYKSRNIISHTGYNVDFTDYANTMNHNHLIAYPYAGQMNVPTGWYAMEDPNPFANIPSLIGKTVGYPVTIQGAMTDHLVISSFKIETAEGAKVPCYEIDAQKPQLGEHLRGAALCVPYKPLASGTEYIATVTGTKNDRSFSVRWSWTTSTSELLTASSGARTVSASHN